MVKIKNKALKRKKDPIIKPAQNGHTYKSIINNGIRYMICQNSIAGGNFYQGRLCNQYVQVANDVVSALCRICTGALVPYEEPITKQKSDKPRGWLFKTVYVHTDGTVYHKGVEQPKLKGTLEPTITVLKQKVKLSTAEKSAKRFELLTELSKLKKQFKKETRKTYQAKLKSSIKKIEREFKRIR